MAVQLIGSASTATWSIASNELGCRISDFTVTVTPEIDTPLLKIDGQVDGGAIGDPTGDLKMSGETLDITTASSAFMVNMYTAFVPVNSTTYFGRSAGGWYLKSGEIKLNRGGWRTFDTSHKSHFALA